jgi:UMP-CMP kinase
MADSSKPLLVFVLGGPGSGKGTQSGNLVEHFGFVHLSAGDLLRAEMASGSQHGEMINEMIKEGKIVPSEVTVGLLDAAMTKSGQERFLIDGFPRNEENNTAWNKEMGDKVDFRFVLSLECPEEVMESRLLKRGETSGRADDNLESIRKRFRTFVDSTTPVVDSYDKKGQVVRISADSPQEAVWAAIEKAFLEKGISKMK